jgi:uncharacterized protein (DUF934 family)
MALIIRERKVQADPWLRLECAADGSFPPVPSAGDVLVPLAMWLALRDDLVLRTGRLGVWLDSQEDPARIAGDLGHFAAIAINFPKFVDGRGYSIAHLLRSRYGWKGELRAVGDVFRDQLFFLESCGFDAFQLRAGEDLQDALSAFADFSEAYQSSIERPQPLFRRRAAPASDGRER